MNSFVTKQILTSQTIGEQLRKTREGMGFEIKEISKKTGIQERYLISIEIGLYGELPGDIYALEFVKKYASFLKIDPKKAAKIYLDEIKETESGCYKFGADAEASRIINRIKWATRSIVALLVFCVLGYSVFYAWGFFSAPSLIVLTPEDYVETKSPSVTLQGKTYRAKKIFINSEPVSFSESGDFIRSYDLPVGETVFKIWAEGVLGKKTVVYKKIVVK